MSQRNHGSQHIWTAGRYRWDVSQRGLVMGILNVTPDSFSDGGSFSTVGKAIQHAELMIEEGADILDIGGESTRPGAATVGAQEEMDRVLPVINALQGHSIALSVDTSKSEVAEAALKAGIDIVNDVSGFRSSDMIDVCADSECGLVVMHMQGEPCTMQDQPTYGDVLFEVGQFFQDKHVELTEAGISSQRIVYDPGIGFGKTLAHNLTLIRNLCELRRVNRPLLVGLSRKSLIASLLEDSELNQRLAPTVALTAYTRSQGAVIHRVHDVAENAQAIRMQEAIGSSSTR